MPVTMTGWICLAALLVSTGCGSALATKHIMWAFDRAPYHRRDTLIMFAFLACMYMAGGLFVIVEPIP